MRDCAPLVACHDDCLMRRLRPVLAALLLAAPCAGPACDDADGDADADADGDADADADGDGDARCAPAEGDYVVPGDGRPEDTWPGCISDDGAYHLVVAETPSSAGRVAAFEQIAALLFGERDDLAASAFTAARLVYAADQGLDSRVQRREDLHYPPAVNATGVEAACQDEGIAERPENHDRCVGPAQILPILNDAFAAGMTGDEPELAAARIEAALLWFLYASVYKEAITCAETPADCDSSWAYYGGGAEARPDGIGLSRYVREAEPRADESAWDAVLAIRCWEDLYDRLLIGDGVEFHERALAQLDRGLDRALATVVAARAAQMEAATGVWPAAHWEAIRILGGALGRAARDVDPALAAELAAELAEPDPALADPPALRALLDQLFPCEPR